MTKAHFIFHSIGSNIRNSESLTEKYKDSSRIFMSYFPCSWTVMSHDDITFASQFTGETSETGERAGTKTTKKEGGSGK